MRKQFIPCDNSNPDAAESLVLDQCPWAAVIEPCDGGCMAFESWDDCSTWRDQK